jgi:hypothetical protein
MSPNRRRRRALSELEMFVVYVVLGAVVGLVLALVFGWRLMPHVVLGIAVGVIRSSWEGWQAEGRDRSSV